jgi:hypothetical protein
MTSTRIELSFNKTKRMSDSADLAELLFPGNKNQQHAFLVLWLALKWSERHLLPNLSSAAAKHGVSRRTLERVRAKMRRMGLIDHVSRFNATHGYREGWMMSTRFERGLIQLAEKVQVFKDTAAGAKEKDLLILRFTKARRDSSFSGRDT